jgi:RNA polymerase sigma-70 factor (ECF subfamily)
LSNRNQISSFKEIKAGDQSAYESLFRACYADLCGFANQFVKDIDAAEDVVQEMFVKLWESRATLSIDRSVNSYLYRAVRNTCLNYLKHQQVKQEHLLHVERSDSATHEDPLSELELQQRIDKILDGLPTECRRVFELSRSEGLKYKEIAEKLSISVKTVENQMGKALKRFRTELKDYLLPFLLMVIEILT